MCAWFATDETFRDHYFLNTETEDVWHERRSQLSLDNLHYNLTYSGIVQEHKKQKNNSFLYPTEVFQRMFLHTCHFLESWSRDTWDGMWFRSQSDHCEGEALAFLGGPGACSPGKFWKSRLSNTHFLMFLSMILHIYRKKNRPKNVHSFLRSEENYRRMNNLNALLYRFFCLDKF